MIIENAGVNKYGAVVDDEGRLNTFSASENEDRHINQQSGKVWSINVDGLQVNSGVYGIYIKNTGTKYLHITDIRMGVRDANSWARIDEVTGTVGGGTTISDVASRHLGTSIDPVATIEEATAATGVTGLTKTGTLFHGWMGTTSPAHLSTSSNIIMNAGTAVAIYFETANATNGITGTISLVETITA